MSWRVKAQHVDTELGHHIVTLEHPDTGATHLLQVIVGHHSCPVCGHVKVVDNLHEIDMKAIIADHIEKLNESHAQVVAHARKHNVPMVGRK